MTKRYGILGFPAKHSLSPVTQNAAFKAADIDAQFGVFEVKGPDLAEFLQAVRHEPISGLAVTAPHKQAVMKFLDEIQEDAENIGAVNTVVNQGGFLHGYNVDFIGIVKALEQVVGSLNGRKVVILGGGGAARSAVYGMIKAGADVEVYNRSMEKAVEIAEKFSKMFSVEIKSGGLEEIVGGDILIQTTSIWIANPEAKCEDLISQDVVGRFEVVMDIIYKPLVTPLLEIAGELGKKTISGDKMFISQAFEQFKLWTGKEAPEEAMRAALAESLV